MHIYELEIRNYPNRNGNGDIAFPEQDTLTSSYYSALQSIGVKTKLWYVIHLFYLFLALHGDMSH